ncbi:MAG TPA: isoprenylcysteine carboxylmethyltransferase family protein [Rhizomicrobium sp.]|nr:isoprenylcysteine carboxylmethyltransferase family protein [Rhizomicrobium sp.]
MSAELTAYALWLAWLVSWGIAALWAAPTVKQPSSRGLWFAHRLLLWLGVLLLFGILSLRYMALTALWRLPDRWKWILDIIIAAGFAFAWWARITIGKLWSADIARKQDHKIIVSGPYALVRHPIYTGILASAFATAAIEGTLVALAGAAIMAGAWYWKARQEEDFLRKELGPAYDDYAERVAMLVPFLSF